MSSQDQATPQPQDVTLENGSTVTVGSILWRDPEDPTRGWVPLKEKALATLNLLSENEIADALSGLLASLPRFAGGAEDPEDSGADIEMGLRLLRDADVLRLVPGVVQKVVHNLDDMTESIVRGCVRDGLPENDMTALDWMRLRQTALEVNDGFRQFLEFERNFPVDLLGGIWRTLSRTSSGNGAPSADHGGSSSNPSSSTDRGIGRSPGSVGAPR